MKVISKIYPKDGSREWECVDGSVVPLVTWLKSDQEVRLAVELQRSASNIFKVVVWNKVIPMRHKLWGYIDSQTTKIIVW